MGIERRFLCRRQEKPGRRRELCLDGGERPRPLCRRDHVRAAKSRRLVGRRRRHVFHRRGISPVHQRNGVGGLFSWRLRFWPQCFLLPALRRPGQGRRTRGQSLFGLPLSPRFSYSLHEIPSRHHRARPRQSPLGQLLFRGLLVSVRTARGVPAASSRRRAHSETSARRRARQRWCRAMSAIDEILEANEIYARTHELRALTPRPQRKLAILTCMDTRLSIRTMGLQTGDAHIIHTDCGLMHATEQELRTRIQNRTGTTAVAPAFFYAFQNIEENVRHQLQKLRTHPWIPKEVTVRGFVYDVVSGRLREIKDF